MARVVIIGGHGKVALRLAPLLVQRGDEVTSVFRNPDHRAAVSETGADVVVADATSLSTKEFAELFDGFDAVVWSAGAGGGSREATFALDRDAAIRSMDAAKAAGVLRYVMVSYLSSSPGHTVPEDDPFFPYAESKAVADEHLRASGLDFTILGPGMLTMDEPTGKIDVIDGGDDGANSVSRADVAAVAAAVLAEEATIGRTIGFRNGATPHRRCNPRLRPREGSAACWSGSAQPVGHLRGGSCSGCRDLQRWMRDGTRNG